MSNDREISLRITAKDDASRSLDKVAEKVDPLEAEPHEVTVTADTAAAESDIATTQGKAEELTGADWAIAMHAKLDKAKADIGDLKGRLDGMVAEDYQATLTADTGPAEKSVAGLQTKIVGKGGVMPSLESGIRQLGGPLGPMASVAAEWSGSLSSMGEVVGSTLGKTGEDLSGFAEKFAVGGAILGGIMLFWNELNGAAARHKQVLEEVKQAQLDIAKGETAAGIQKFIDSHKAAFDALEAIGVSAADAWKLLTGEIAPTTENIAALGGDLSKLDFSALIQITSAATDWTTTNADLQVLQERVFEIAKAAGASGDEFLQMAKEALPAVRAEILNYIADVNGIPRDKITAILTDADPDDVAQVKKLLDDLTKDRTVTVGIKGPSEIFWGWPTKQIGGVGSGPTLVHANEVVDLPPGTAVHPTPAGYRGGAVVVDRGVVNQYFPVGITPEQVEAGRRRWQRRNGAT